MKKTSNIEYAYIIGSGFSKDLLNIPTLLGLSKDILDYLKSVAQEGRNHYPEVRDYIQRHIPQDIQQNIEHLMTVLRGRSPWFNHNDEVSRKSCFGTIVEVVAELIDEKQTEGFGSSHYNYESLDTLGKLINQWKEQRATVITFNYDTVVETKGKDLIESDNQNFLKRIYVGPFTNLIQRTSGVMDMWGLNYFFLIKLHGSINWYYSGNENFSGEPIYFDPLLDNKSQQLAFIAENKADLQPLIIPPLTQKDSFLDHSLLRYQWREAFKGIVQADRIFVIGYSLPATNLMAKFMLNEAVKLSKANWHILVYHEDYDKTKMRYNELLQGKNVNFYRVDKGESSAKKLESLVESVEVSDPEAESAK